MFQLSLVIASKRTAQISSSKQWQGEHLTVPEGKKVLKKEKKKPTNAKRTQEPTEEFPVGKEEKNLNNKTNSIILDYNRKYKINIHNSVCIHYMNINK